MRAASLLGLDHIPSLKPVGLKNTRRVRYFFVIDTKDIWVGIYYKIPTVHLNHPTKIWVIFVAGAK